MKVRVQDVLDLVAIARALFPGLGRTKAVRALTLYPDVRNVLRVAGDLIGAHVAAELELQAPGTLPRDLMLPWGVLCGLDAVRLIGHRAFDSVDGERAIEVRLGVFRSWQVGEATGMAYPTDGGWGRPRVER